MHIPPVDPIGVRNGSFANRNEAAKLLTRLARGGVDLTLYGHIHSYYAFENAGIPAHISGGGGAIPSASTVSVGTFSWWTSTLPTAFATCASCPSTETSNEGCWVRLSANAGDLGFEPLPAVRHHLVAAAQGSERRTEGAAGR